MCWRCCTWSGWDVLLQAVQQVITNLLLSHIELRTEQCIDIKPYTHERKVEKIVVALGEELLMIQKKYIQVRGTLLEYKYNFSLLNSYILNILISLDKPYTLSPLSGDECSGKAFDPSASSLQPAGGDKSLQVPYTESKGGIPTKPSSKYACMYKYSSFIDQHLIISLLIFNSS